MSNASDHLKSRLEKSCPIQVAQFWGRQKPASGGNMNGKPRLKPRSDNEKPYQPHFEAGRVERERTLLVFVHPSCICVSHILFSWRLSRLSKYREM